MKLRFWLLAALTLSLALGSCSKGEKGLQTRAEEFPEAVGEAIDEAVPDPARAQQAKDETIRIQYAIADYYKQLLTVRTKAFYLAANYNTTPEDYEGYFKELEELRLRKRPQLTEAALAVRKTMTAAEWSVYVEKLHEKLDIQE